ncbi:hypothetical protein AB8O64_23450 [Streptomyces sp. QH1-20]|uniref:hypothetical protein n=1 Tax=Streptomyces sp. QH1-20 TaxID=3240934 RepID=UPI003512748F
MEKFIFRWFAWARALRGVKANHPALPVRCPDRPSEPPRPPAPAVVARMSAHGIDIVTRPPAAAR